VKIDIFPHIHTKKYSDVLEKKLPPEIFKRSQGQYVKSPELIDLKRRFSMMDQHGDVVQVINLAVPFVERVTDPKLAVELAKIGNDELAALVEKYPDRFIGAVGNLPMNDIDAALDEIDRIVNKLHFRGIQICTNINGKPLDSLEFMPLYEKMEKYDLPILLHPERPATVADYPTEDLSKYWMHLSIGWPYETSAAMMRLVFGNVMHRFPKIKFVTHHCGGMIPFFNVRIETFYGYHKIKYGSPEHDMSPAEYFRRFYADTALYGNPAGLTCGCSFFSVDHLLFGTDMPYGTYGNHSVVEETIKAVNQMEIGAVEKQKIFEGNARRLFKL
jgi:predicted TIM-barrel fold metal-dependent hydrolase